MFTVYTALAVVLVCFRVFCRLSVFFKFLRDVLVPETMKRRRHLLIRDASQKINFIFPTIGPFEA